MSVSDIKRCPNCHKIVSAYSVCPICGYVGLHKLEDNSKVVSSPRTNEAIERNNIERARPAPNVTQNKTETKIVVEQPKKSSGAKQWEVVGIIAGIILIIVGIMNIFSIKDLRFGADFYTEVYRVVATCARGIHGVIITIGVFMVIYFGHQTGK